MHISEFTVRMVVLFLPGIVAYAILQNLTVVREKGPFYFALYALVLGFLSYLVYALVLQIVDLVPFVTIDTKVKFFDALFVSSEVPDSCEVLWASLTSVFNGFLLSFVINRKYLHRFAQRLGVTKKFGDLDVWSYLFNSRDDNMRWVTVRDIENDLVYQGYIEAFSDTYNENELFLRDVVVYSNKTGAELYSVPGLYISREKDQLTIEFQGLVSEEEALSNGQANY